MPYFFFLNKAVPKICGLKFSDIAERYLKATAEAGFIKQTANFASFFNSYKILLLPIHNIIV